MDIHQNLKMTQTLLRKYFFLLLILRFLLLFIFLLIIIIHCPSLILLLDHQHDGENREAAEGEDVAEPFDSNVRDGEDAQEDHTDDVVPGGNHIAIGFGV